MFSSSSELLPSEEQVLDQFRGFLAIALFEPPGRAE
jgi:hypothetical protein